jgi:hypothetical protein
MVGLAIYIVSFLICAWAAMVVVVVGVAALGAIFMVVGRMLQGLCGFVDWTFKEGWKEILSGFRDFADWVFKEKWKVKLTIVSGIAFWIAGAKLLPPHLALMIAGVVVALALLVALAIMVKDFVEWFRSLPKIRIR